MTFAPREPVLLRLLIERHYLADCCVGTSERYQWSFGAAVRLWGADLGREPNTDDLTVDAIAKFLRHLRHAGHRVDRIRERRNRLHTLWAYAYRRGLASCPGTVKVAEVAGCLELPASDRPAKPPQVFISREGQPKQKSKVELLLESAPPPGTARHFFLTVYLPERLADKGPDSHREHLAVHRSLLAHYQRDLLLAEQTNALAAEHFRWMKDQGQSNVAINKISACWFAEWRHAVGAELVARLPTIKKFKVPRRAPDAWTIAEMKQMLAAADPFWRAVLLVGYWTLQRRRALFSIEPKHCDLSGGWIDFPPSSMKSNNGIRCRIPDEAVDAIRQIWSPTRRSLFEWSQQNTRISDQRCNGKRLSEAFRELIARAGVRPSLLNNGQFHKLRRTGATHAVIKGGMSVVCDLLGQSSITVTRRYIDKSQLPGHDVTRLLPLLMDDFPQTERLGP